MSYTNKTPNYEYPQYIGTDKPSYLGDFNSFALNLDTDIKAIDTKCEGAIATSNNAISTAETALEEISNASSSANTATTTANSAKTLAENAQNSASSAQTTATSALSKANENTSSISQILQDISSLNDKLVNWVNGTFVNEKYNLNYSFNNFLKSLTFYGNLKSGQTHGNSNDFIIGTLPSNFQSPSSKRTIMSAGQCISSDGSKSDNVTMSVDVNNVVRINVPVHNVGDSNAVYVQVTINTSGWYTP